MKIGKLEELLLKYLDGEFEPDREAELKSLFKQHGYDDRELMALKQVYNQLDHVSVPPAGAQMTENFYQMLESYQQTLNRRNWFNSLLYWLHEQIYPKLTSRLAYSLVLLFVGWIIGFWLTPDYRYEKQLHYLSSEIRQMRELVTLSLLNESSPVDRMVAINKIDNLDQVNEKVIQALLKTLNQDANVNVRLVAVEALLKLAHRPSVRQGLLYAIDRQESPLVQLALTDAMVLLQEKNALVPLTKLLENKELNDVVRTRIKKSLKILI